MEQLLPSRSGRGGAAAAAVRSSRAPVADDNALSLVFGPRAVHLVLPRGGNGRSRDEWLAAFGLLLGAVVCRPQGPETPP